VVVIEPMRRIVPKGEASFVPARAVVEFSMCCGSNQIESKGHSVGLVRRIAAVNAVDAVGSRSRISASRGVVRDSVD
jgi:hypothetical protein